MPEKNFLLVGNGAREHAIAAAICRDKAVRLFACMTAKNPGISALCEISGGEFAICDTCNPGEISSFAKSKNISLAFSSPDATLQAGVSDALMNLQIPCASPTRAASRIEWDKSFARGLMQKHNIPGNPRFGVFEDAKPASDFIDSLGGMVAVKPSGLTGGKGVKVAGAQLKDGEEAKKYAGELLMQKAGGIGSVVIEEKLIGEEFTLQAFSDGKSIVPMPLVQDHKLSLEGERGENTGGMGSYSDPSHLLPFVSKGEHDYAVSIMQKTITALASEKNSFVGVLYGQFIATKQGIKVIEFNARFGDPEAMNVLSILEGGLYPIFESMAKGALPSQKISFAKKATVCKYLVPEGYPENPVAGLPIEINWNCVSGAGAKLYFASVYEKLGKIYMQKSRSIGVLGLAGGIAEAEKIAESACPCVKGNLRHRPDIGTKALINRKIERMKQIRKPAD